MTDGFDFIAAYRDLDAAAPRDVIEARKKSHDKLWSAITDMGHIYDLCRLAFLLDPPPASDWFEEPMREFDPHFVLKKDTVDAGRMAALLLRQQMEQKGSYAPLTVLAGSFCGKRHSVDDDLLAKCAAEKFAAAVRDHRVTDGAKLAAAPKLTAIKVELDALAAQNPVTGPVAKDAVAASMTSAETAIGALSDNVEKPLAATRGDVARLAEEVDMLWWHIGDWHELLGKPRSDTPTEAKMIVSGIELGTMVRQLPGPYGANGILRRISAADGDGKTTLRAAVRSLSQGDAQKLSAHIPASSQSLFPIHAAIGMAAGGAAWEAELSRVVPEIAGTEVTHFELGVQAFRERALIKHGGLS
jgi:GTPase-associated system helical domain